MKKKLEKVLFKTMLYMFPITLVVYGYSLGIHALANKIYQDMTASFLATGSPIVTSHNQKLTMIVLPSPSVSVTPLVKTAKLHSK